MIDELKKHGKYDTMNERYAIMVLSKDRMEELVEQWKNEQPIFLILKFTQKGDLKWSPFCYRG